MSKNTIYIAGPMRGVKYFNFDAFDQARDRLEGIGWRVISPADLDRQAGFDPWDLPDDYDWQDLSKIGFDLHAAIERDVKALMECSAIFMLHGWQNSRGAKAEKAIAEWMGLTVLYSFVYFGDPLPEVPDPQPQPQKDILEEALEITKGDRQASYGPPDQDFARTAAMWEVLLAPCIKGERLQIKPAFVAMCMIALKLSRETHQAKRDNAVDIAGYSRCLDICRQCEGVTV